jgi:hypothetical protein
MKRVSRGVAILFAFCFAPVAATHAELIGVFGPITIEATHIPTPQLPGFSTWTLSATSSLPLYDFEFSPYTGGLFPGYGFHGPMNQVNPAGVATVFKDADPFFSFVGANPLQDSQFLVLSSDVTRPGGVDFESGNFLSSAFARPNFFGTHVDFAQIVKPDISLVTFLGRIYDGQAGPLDFGVVSGTLGLVPEPSCFSLLGFGMAAIGFSKCRRFR